MLSQEEKEMIIGLFPFLSENPIVFDGGSNKGSFSDLFVEEYGDKCQLHLFEPNKKLLSFTEIKYEYKTNITYVESALYKEIGKVPFYYFENYNNEISSLYSGGESWKELPLKSSNVTAITVDQYCKDHSIKQIDYLKLDLEGSDVDALIGTKEMIESGSIKIIQFEYGEHYKRSGHTLAEVFELIKDTGYKIYRYAVGNYWELKELVEDYKAENFIITKECIFTHSGMGYNSRFVEMTEGIPKCDLILEIGAFEGVTTKYMAEQMLAKDGRIIVIDPLRDYYVTDDPRYHQEFKGQYQRFLRNTRGLPVELKRGLSEDELPKLNALRFDFIYVDGNHYAPWPYLDGVWAFAICKLGAYILFDDYDTWAQDTKDSIDKFINEFSGSLDVVKRGYQVLVRKHTNQYNESTIEYYK